LEVARQAGSSNLSLNPFYAMAQDLFDFRLFRFSFGETTEEAIRKRKSKSYGKVSFLM
jgi:hypothetical protein